MRSFEESLRKVAEGKLSPCLEIIYNARIPKHQALRIIQEGMKAAAQATHLKPKYHRLYHHKLGLLGVVLEFPGKSMARKIVSINVDFVNQFISKVLGQIKSLGMQIFTARNKKTVKSLLAERKQGNEPGLYISSRFIPSCRFQARRKIAERILKIDGDEITLVYDQF